MIEGFWQAVAILGTITGALLGGFWRFLRAVESNKKRYQNDAKAMRSLVLSSELVPQIISLMDKVEREKNIDPTASIEEILSRRTFAKPVEDIAKSATKTIEVDSLYFKIIDHGFKCAHDLLILAPLPVISVIWLYAYDGELTQPLIFLSCAIVFYLVAGSIKIIRDILKYTSAIRLFIEKDNEIRFGKRSQQAR